MSADRVMIQFVVHDALLPSLVAWLDERRTDLVQIPVDDDDLPTFIASPRDPR